jgi:hypothetical protein
MLMVRPCAQIVAVDQSAGTAMAVMKLGNAIGQHYGPEVTALRVLPLLCPLLMCPGLNTAQFSSYMTTIRGLLDKVAEKRAGELTAAGVAGCVATAARVSSGPGSTGSRASAGDLADGLFGGPAGGTGASEGLGGISPKVGSGRLGAVGVASWDTPVAASPRRAAAAAASAAAGQSWSSADWSSSSTGVMNAGGSSWQQPQQLQQQQQQWSMPAASPTAGVSGRPSGMAAPDIFSSAPSNGDSFVQTGMDGGDLLGGLSLGSGVGGGSAGPGPGSSSSSSTPYWSLGASTAAPASANHSTDLFGRLAVAGQGSSNGGRGIIHQQQAATALRPPPSASKPINLLGGEGAGGGGVSSSSSRQDPFAGLAGPANNGNAAGSAVFDPFSSLAAAPASKGLGGGDAFADLSSGVVGGSRPMNSQRPQQQQQQHQQWGSLI